MADMPGIPAGLPLIAAGCDAADLAFGSGADFWENLDEVVAGCGLEAELDRALSGRSTPRVWVLVHEPGHPQLAVAAALAFARALAARGQAALVLDGDDHATALSRWAGRDGAEGWIDIVRYGTSVLTAGVALPFAGRTAYLLGVGSYAPTDATAEEIDQLLSRLRRQADDLLVVLPGGAQAGTWARRADIRLLCHDQAVLTPTRLGAVVANLTVAGVAPTALVGFGRPAPGVRVDGAAVAAAQAEPDAEGAATGPAHDHPDEASVTAALAGLEQRDATGGESEARYDRRRGTSAVFWLVAVAAAVMIALVGVYYVKFVRVPDGSVFGDAPTAAVAPDRLPQAGPPAVFVDTTRTAAAAVPDSQALGAAAGAPADTARTGPAVPEVLPPPAAAAGDVAAADGAAAPADSAVAAVPDFEPAPYRVPVGTDGWALQVYSFRDSVSADKQMAQLGRRGLRSAVRIVDLPESGRWWRVYVGSFPSRQAARAAEPALFGKLRIDWARPARFTVAVTDTAGR